MSSIPSTQSVWLMTARGAYKDILKLDSSYPVPTPAAGEVLVKVRYAALNPVGYKTMKGPISYMRKVPNVVEYDLSGVVANANGTAFKDGDEVFGIIPANLNMKTGNGAFAQYTVVKEEHLVQKPEGLKFDVAAGLPLVGLTAWGGLLKQGGLKSGQKVFINGGGTSVGRVAIGIAKETGATVIVSCSESSAETCKKLGADEIVDYKKVSLPEHLSQHHGSQPIDLILDLVGNKADLFALSERYTAPTAKYIMIGGDPPKGVVGMASWAGSLAKSTLAPSLLGGVKRSFKFWLMEPDNDGLRQLGDWAKSGKIDLQIDSTHSFDQAGVFAAYDRLYSQKATGKVLVEVPQ